MFGGVSHIQNLSEIVEDSVFCSFYGGFLASPSVKNTIGIQLEIFPAQNIWKSLKKKQEAGGITFTLCPPFPHKPGWFERVLQKNISLSHFGPGNKSLNFILPKWLWFLGIWGKRWGPFMTVTGRGQDPIFKHVNSKSLKVGNWLNEQCQLFFRHRHHQDNTSFSGLGIRRFSLEQCSKPLWHFIILDGSLLGSL